MFKVMKKNETVEDFDREKVIQGIKKAGGSDELAQEAASNIETQFAEGETVPAMSIKEKVVAFLKTKDQQIADAFESFKKS